MAGYDEETLHAHWVHSHEEDRGDEMVFRPAGYAFPPARGRTSIDLRADGTYVELSPGPADVPEESKGSWSLEGDRLLLGAEGDRPGHAWELASLEPGRLIVRG